MPVPTDLKLFILMGQSNMAGYGELADYPPRRPAYGSRLWNYKFNGTWQNPAAEPVHVTAGSVYPILANDDALYRVGPGLFFADHFARYNTFNVGLIPCAVGGTRMDEWARPTGGTDTNTLYGASRARWDTASANGVISGAIFYQGEADTATVPAANAWPAKLIQMVVDVRSDTGKPNLPFVFVQLGPCSPAHHALRAGWDTLQIVQSQITTPRVMMVPNLDATLLPGNDVHVDTAAMQVIGERAADCMRILGAGY